MFLTQKCKIPYEKLRELSRYSLAPFRTHSLIPKKTMFSFGSLSPNNDSTIFFLKGLDERILSKEQQEKIAEYVKQDPLGQSFLIYNSNEAIRKITQWKQKLPWIQPFYAIKSNPIAPLVKDVTANGAGVDVASAGEIKYCLELGIPASSMIYSNPVKEEKDILYAAQEGVEYTTADTFDELEKIKRIAPEMKILWRISISEDNKKQLATVFSNKFGDDVISEEDTYSKFKYIGEELQIKLHGIHFHCGSGKNGSTSFLKAVQAARKCIEIGRNLGHSMEILDLGGGYPSGDLHDSFTSALLDTARDPLGYKVIAEPGRHFSSHCCHLLTRVLAKRIKQEKTCFHVNDSLYHSFNCILMDGVSFENDNEQFYSALNGASTGKDSLLQGSLFGMTCDGSDVIAKNFSTPNSLKVGDWLCLGGMGSYTFGPKSSFNGMQSTSRVFEWDTPLGVPSQGKIEIPSSKPSGQQTKEESPIWIPREAVRPAF